MRSHAQRWSALAAALLCAALAGACETDEGADIGSITQAVEPPNEVKDLATFVACLNKESKGNDVSSAVACIPDGCGVILTKSAGSAQAACTIGECVLPRVIFRCEGPPVFMPSFLLCPKGSVSEGDKVAGVNRVETAEVVTTDPFAMEMADIPILKDNPGFAIKDVVSVKNSKGCNSDNCHAEGAGNKAPNGGLPLSAELTPADSRIVFSTIDGWPAKADKASDFDAICGCIDTAIKNGDKELDTRNGRVAQALCQKLRDYVKTRGKGAGQEGAGGGGGAESGAAGGSGGADGSGGFDSAGGTGGFDFGAGVITRSSSFATDIIQ
jgi:hypothetical protein